MSKPGRDHSRNSQQREGSLYGISESESSVAMVSPTLQPTAVASSQLMVPPVLLTVYLQRLADQRRQQEQEQEQEEEEKHSSSNMLQHVPHRGGDPSAVSYVSFGKRRSVCEG